MLEILKMYFGFCAKDPTRYPKTNEQVGLSKKKV
jgi:hypothetical protein